MNNKEINPMEVMAKYNMPLSEQIAVKNSFISMANDKSKCGIEYYNEKPKYYYSNTNEGYLFDTENEVYLFDAICNIVKDKDKAYKAMNIVGCLLNISDDYKL